MASCPECGSDDLELDGVLDDGRRRVRCDVGHQFLLGTAAPKSAAAFNSLAEARKRFPTSDDVDKARLARVDALKSQFLSEHPEPQPAVAAYWAHYQEVSSHDGLQVCDPQDLKDFANNSVGANPGNQSGFNKAWNEMGVDAAVEQTRGAIDYLLCGPDSIPLEDRLTDLIDPSTGHAWIQRSTAHPRPMRDAARSIHPDPDLQQHRSGGEARDRESGVWA